jgi:hypothetical protein
VLVVGDRPLADRGPWRITEDFYNKKLVEYRTEQTNIQIKQKELQEVDKDYYSKGIYLLKLANKAPAIFKSSEPEVQRQLIKLVLQNPTINGVTLCADYRKPFGIFAEGSSRHTWLPGLVSQSVLLWDRVRLEMKRIGKGRTRINLLSQEMIDEVPVLRVLNDT